MTKMRSLVLYNLLQLVIILFMISKTSDACSCAASHPQELFCRADYVIYARVIGRCMMTNEYNKGTEVRWSQVSIEYKLNITKIFKMSKEAQMYLKKSTIITSGSDSMCGVELQMNKLYAIAGRGHQLSLCDFVMEHSLMTKAQRRGLAISYRHGCDCFSYSFRPFSPKHLQSGSCDFAPGSCEERFGVCTHRNNSECHWWPTKEYNKCKKNLA